LLVIEHAVDCDGFETPVCRLRAGRGEALYNLAAIQPGVRITTGGRRHEWRHRVISSEFLLHKAAAGDSAALRECVARYGGLVWSLARRLQLPESQAEDVVQEIFTDLWRSGHRYDPTIASETAFVATVARRRLIDRRRKLSRTPTMQALSEDAPIRHQGLPVPDRSEVAGKAAEALRSLSDDQQRVLRLSVYEGLSHDLISRSTGLPLGTVKTHARRGLMKLRELLIGGPDGAESRASADRVGHEGGVKP